MVALVHNARLLVDTIVARGLEFFSLVRDTLIEARQDQIRLEAELSRRRYRPSAKKAGDGPIVRSVARNETE
jgi:hypothetical protein